MNNGIDPVTIQLIIGAISVIISAIVVVITVGKGSESQAKETGKILASIDSMKEVLADLKSTTKDVTARVTSLESKVATEEATLVLITSRLEQLEKRKEGN